MTTRTLCLLLLAITLVLITTIVAAQNDGTTIRVSVASDGTEGNRDSEQPSISAEGRYVAFRSLANNWVLGDEMGTEDIFVHDRLTGQTRLVSVASSGSAGNRSSDSPSISADASVVAFWSWAYNLVEGDTNNSADVFIHDLSTNQTTLVSVASDGTIGNSSSTGVSLSADGRYVAFSSLASNLIEDDTNGDWDVFVKDRQSGRIVRVSVASDGSQANSDSNGYKPPSISADGQRIAFWSLASNLVEDDTEGYEDIFVHDRKTGQTTRVSVSSDGTGGNDDSSTYSSPVISADGRYVAFSSYASNLVENDNNGHADIFVHDLLTAQTSRVSVTSSGKEVIGSSQAPAISRDGRFVAFRSSANNLVLGDTNGDTDVFLHDRQTGETTRLSVANDSTEGNHASGSPSLSANADEVAFVSSASNLVPNDTNSVADIFVHLRADETATPTVTLTATQNNTATPINTVPPNTEMPTSTTTSTETPTATACSTPPTPSCTSTATATPTFMPSLTPTLMPSPSPTTSYRLYLPLLLH